MSVPKSKAMAALSQVIDNDHMLKISSEFTRLGERCYLDNAGATLYPRSLPQSINEDLINNFYMNPHSDQYTRDCIEQIRCLILKHFNTDPSNYTVIFTSGTTQSLKLVVESFKFSSDKDDSDCGSFVYLRDNHTSVLGLRELAENKNADIIHISHEDFLLSLNNKHNSLITKANNRNGNSIFAYPAQSNFNGFKYPIDCIEKIKEGCLNNNIKKHLCKINTNWYILLDVASHVSTNRLDLSRTQPDFVCLSFYKIFGYPTGLGALLVKNSSQSVLSQKRYFGGGTVDIVLSSEDFHVKRKELHERYEDGTLPFLSIIALKHCFEMMHRLVPKVVNGDIMETLSYHTFYLAKDLYHNLLELKHNNGKKAVVLYMDSDFSDIKKQGGVVTFNLLREDGSYIGYAEFQHMADLFNISVRTGCFCNSGSCQRHLMVTNKELKDMYKAGHKCGDEIDLVNGRPTGAIRVSFGYFNTFNDVDKLIHMICKCFIKANVKKVKRIVTKYKNIDTALPNKVTNDAVTKLLNEHEYFSLVEEVSTNFECKAVLKEIAIFPIKSCGAFKIRSSWNIGPKGFEYDREWMIIKDNGVCLTQKQNSRMCLICPKIDLKHKLMILNCKGMLPISIPLDPHSHNKFKDTTLCQSKVCTDIIKGFDCGDEVANWISEALEISFLRLIRQSSNDKRKINKKSDENKLLSLSNQAQYLLINKATVRWLGTKIRDPSFTDSTDQLTDRFRGNIIIDTEDELVEREWQRIIIGKQEFKVEGQCPRCQMVCIDQHTGVKTVEPLRTIAEQFGGKLRFGIYLSYIGPHGESKERSIKTNTYVKAIANDDQISR
ncbi:hypothetical protein K1T71_005599 [Dendrolimus kikuchii]|uniref:Uncharacterized protein n=1 Tax=Dendrolimus kikuchii TaxID=765133 RepID=A0ACC1D520_9NEOP|nr:hypothetical protein K1T71_005599 [Dendrolimus kikuchii]